KGILQTEVPNAIGAAIGGDRFFPAEQDNAERVLEVGRSDRRTEAIDDRDLPSGKFENMPPRPGRENVRAWSSLGFQESGRAKVRLRLDADRRLRLPQQRPADPDRRRENQQRASGAEPSRFLLQVGDGNRSRDREKGSCADHEPKAHERRCQISRGKYQEDPPAAPSASEMSREENRKQDGRADGAEVFHEIHSAGEEKRLKLIDRREPRVAAEKAKTFDSRLGC